MIYGFCRISSDNNGTSLDSQEQEINTYINEKYLGKTIRVKTIIKCISSAFKKIPKELLNLNSVTNSTLIFCSIDRFSRNYELGYQLANKFIAKNNVIVFTRENIRIDKNTNEETWNIFQEALKLAELESKNISDRVKTAKIYLESKGYYTGSLAPVGYKKIKSTNGRYKIIMDSNLQHIIKFISACKSKGTTINCLNKLLILCGADVEQPLTLDNNANQLLTDLTYENIANILNDYSIGDRKWNKNTVAKLHKKSKLEDNTQRIEEYQREVSVDSKREIETTKDYKKIKSDNNKSNKRKIIKIKSSRIHKKRKTNNENNAKDKIEILLLEERQDNLDIATVLSDRSTSIKDNTLDGVSDRLNVLKLNNKRRKYR